MLKFCYQKIWDITKENQILADHDTLRISLKRKTCDIISDSSPIARSLDTHFHWNEADSILQFLWSRNMETELFICIDCVR
jgi:hypothetical protein